MLKSVSSISFIFCFGSVADDDDRAIQIYMYSSFKCTHIIQTQTALSHSRTHKDKCFRRQAETATHKHRQRHLDTGTCMPHPASSIQLYSHNSISRYVQIVIYIYILWHSQCMRYRKSNGRFGLCFTYVCCVPSRSIATLDFVFDLNFSVRDFRTLFCNLIRI